MSLAKLLPRGAMLKDLVVRSKNLVAGAAVFAALAGGLFYPTSAQAWWGPGWGWHAGWAWRPGVVVTVPPVAVGAPVYAAPAHRWVPAHYSWNGYFIPGHWAY
jgi:hypothetical protein